MSRKKLTFEEFMEQYGDCPEELFKMAKTPFQKAVAVEFYNIISKIDEHNNNRKREIAEVKKDISWCKWLTMALFGVVVLGVVAQNIQNLLHLLGF